MANVGLHTLSWHMVMESTESIRVDAVVRTSIYSFDTDTDTDTDTGEIEVLGSFNAGHPIARMRLPEDLASVIGFLLGDNADWIAGADWGVRGHVMAVRD